MYEVNSCVLVETLKLSYGISPMVFLLDNNNNFPFDTFLFVLPHCNLYLLYKLLSCYKLISFKVLCKGLASAVF